MLLEVAPATRDNVRFGIDRACICAHLNGEAIYIAADRAADCFAHRSFLLTLTSRYPGVSMREIHDTLNDVVMSDLIDDNAEMLDALAQMQHDEALIEVIRARGPTVIELVAMADHYRACVEWFSIHAPDPVTRQRMILTLIEIDALRAANAERAQRMLERMGANGHAN
jgi:hypothetical protein